MSDQDSAHIMTVADVSGYLKLSEKTVLKMVRNNEIPCTKIGNQWRFMKEVLDDWLVSRMTTHSEPPVAATDVSDGDAVLLAGMIDPRLMSLALEGTDRGTVLTELSGIAEQYGVVADGGRYAKLLVERERLASTALDNGVALPHARRSDSSIVRSPHIIVGRSDAGVDFHALNGEVSRLFFVIASVDDATHLRTMSRLTSLLRDAGFVRRLMEARDAGSIFGLIAGEERRTVTAPPLNHSTGATDDGHGKTEKGKEHE